MPSGADAPEGFKRKTPGIQNDPLPVSEVAQIGARLKAAKNNYFHFRILRDSLTAFRRLVFTESQPLRRALFQTKVSDRPRIERLRSTHR